MGFNQWEQSAEAIPGVGQLVAAARPVTQIFAGIGHALGIGGHTQAEKDAERVRRADQLTGCAESGNVEAARRVLFGAQNTHSTSPAGVTEYQQDWQLLSSLAPNVAAEASRLGPVGDSGDASQCPPDSGAATPRLSVGSGPGGAPGATAGHSGAALPVLAGAGLLVAALVFA